MSKNNKRKIISPRKYNKRPKVKGIRALYLHYCYLLKVFPKHNFKYKLTPEMRKEVKKTERISEQNKFVFKYNIYNFKDIAKSI